MENNVVVEVEQDHIGIYEGEKEIVYWHEDEWNEDPSIVIIISNAIKLAYTNINELKRLLGRD